MSREHALGLWGEEVVTRAMAEATEPSEEVARLVATRARELSREAFGAWAKGEPWPTFRAAVRAVVAAEALLGALDADEPTDRESRFVQPAEHVIFLDKKGGPDGNEEE